MKFWDSSALLPLVIEETTSKACRALRRADPAVAVWTLTRVELASALHRLVRDGTLGRLDLNAALRRMDLMIGRFTEVAAVDHVRERAERVLGMHPLRAADALQLGAALVLVQDRPRRRGFVTSDERLVDAAGAEGFDVIIPGE
jgi:predicted nucleic acid-binding protein